MMLKSWIDESKLLASSNPSDEGLARLRAQGFGLAVSLLVEHKQPPGYDKKSAASTGWAIYSIPIEEGATPSLVQVCEFTALIGAVPKATRTLVFCDRGLGRAPFMGAVYWIAKGLTVADATTRIAGSAGVDPGWKTEAGDEVLRKFEQLGWRIHA